MHTHSLTHTLNTDLIELNLNKAPRNCADNLHIK